MASPAKQARTHAHRHGRSPLFSSPGPRYDPVCFLARLITSTSTSQKKGRRPHHEALPRPHPDNRPGAPTQLTTRHTGTPNNQPISATQNPHPDEPPRILCSPLRARHGAAGAPPPPGLWVDDAHGDVDGGVEVDHDLP
jgi:hypothetical protein